MSHRIFILKRHFSPNFGCCCVWVSFSFSVAIRSENVICAERLEDSCCSDWFGALCLKTIPFIFMYGIALAGVLDLRLNLWSQMQTDVWSHLNQLCLGDMNEKMQESRDCSA